MKYIAISQRVREDNKREERCDELDQAWTSFLFEIGALPILIPNKVEDIDSFLKELPISGIILSGGGNLSAFSSEDIDLEREITENSLIEYAQNNKIPLIGVCRGMQAVCHKFGTTIKKIEKHVATRHEITTTNDEFFTKALGKTCEVNSFHEFAPTTETIQKPLTVCATSENIVEAIKHNTDALYGIMWHPERERPFRKAELDLFSLIFSL